MSVSCRWIYININQLFHFYLNICLTSCHVHVYSNTKSKHLEATASQLASFICKPFTSISSREDYGNCNTTVPDVIPSSSWNCARLCKFVSSSVQQERKWNTRTLICQKQMRPGFHLNFKSPCQQDRQVKLVYSVHNGREILSQEHMQRPVSWCVENPALWWQSNIDSLHRRHMYYTHWKKTMPRLWYNDQQPPC